MKWRDIYYSKDVAFKEHEKIDAAKSVLFNNKSRANLR